MRTNQANGLGTGAITLNNAVIMSGTDSLNVSQTLTLVNWGGFRASSKVTVSGKITGTADLIIATDGQGAPNNANDSKAAILTYSGNDYTGVTGIGTMKGQDVTDGYARLKLGASNVLPSTTVVEIGRTSVSTNAANSQLILGSGTENTVAGVHGVGQILGDTSAATLNINAASGQSYTLTGALIGYTGGITLNIGGAGTQSFGGATAIANTVNFTVNSGTLEFAKTAAVTAATTLTVNNGGTFQIASAATGEQQITGLMTVNTGGTANINGKSISNGGLSGAGAITGNGQMRITPAADATYTGSLALASLTVDGGAGVQTIGGTQDFSNTNLTVSGGSLALNATFTDGKIGNNVTLSGGTLTIGSNVGTTVSTGGAFRFTGGSLNLGARTLAVTGGLAGNGVVTGGTIDATLEAGQTYNFTGTLAGVSGTDVLKLNIGGDATGKQILGGAVAAANTNITLNAGTLQLNKSDSAATVANNLALNGGKLEFGNTTAMQRVTDTVTVGAGMGTSIDLNGGILAAKTYDTSAATAGFKFVNSNASQVGTLFFTNVGTSTFTAHTGIMDNANMRLGLWGTGGQIRLNKTQNFEGGIWVKETIVRPDPDGNAEMNPTTRQSFLGKVPETFVANSIILDQGTIQNSSGNIIIDKYQGIYVTENGGTVRTGNGNQYTTTINSVISGPGWFGVSGDNAGGAILNAVNTYEGGTRIGSNLYETGDKNATLTTNISGALPAGRDVSLLTTGSLLKLNNTTQSIGALTNTGGTINFGGTDANLTATLVTNSGTINLDGGNMTATSLTGTGGTIKNDSTTTALLTLNNISGEASYSGTITGNIKVVKTGTSRQIINGAQTHTGGTLIQEGVLRLNGTASTLGSGTITFDNQDKTDAANNYATLMLENSKTLANDIELLNSNDLGQGFSGGSLRMTNAITVTLNGNISGDGTLFLNRGEGGGSAQSIIFNGNNTYTGGTSVYGAGALTLVAASDSAFGTEKITMNNSSTPTIQFDTTAGKRTISNNIDLNGRNLALTRSGANQAVYAGEVSGTGNLSIGGVDLYFDLDSVADPSTDTFWAGLYGTIDFTSPTTIHLLTADPFQYVGENFSLFGNTTATGVENVNLLLPTIPDINWEWTATEGAGINFILNGYSVPEPTTWAMLLLGVLGVGILRKKRAAV